VEFEEPARSFPALRELVDSGEFEFPEQVRLRSKVIEASEMIYITGEVETRLSLACGRCLKPLLVSVSKNLALAYSRSLPEVHDDDNNEALELTAEEMGLTLASGDEIDLRDAVQEQVVMALPMQPLCDPDCKGLCPRCGKDLNRGECGCSTDTDDHPFADLKKLQF
jgi:DUF177 domain-containing protein